MKNKLYKITNKLPGLSYAFTLNGLELPVMDITHPDFISCIDENKLIKMIPYVEKKAVRNAKKFNKIPKFIKNYIAKHSFAMAELIQGEESVATGISTLIMKLGPKLLGKGEKRFWDRQVTKGFGALVIRMRGRDISECQAEALIPILKKEPKKSLCFINIAGGAASDNINALFLIQQKNAELLKNRKIEINVLDIDDFGPGFAERCIEALKMPGGKFHDLNISFRHIHYDWNNTKELGELLLNRNNWIQLCSSEGGIFEYCSNNVIIENLNTIYNNSSQDVIITGTLLEIEKVVASLKEALKISRKIKPGFLGLAELKNIVKENNWNISNIRDGNPVYLIFTLNKI
jgi:hypothetical protein